MTSGNSPLAVGGCAGLVQQLETVTGPFRPLPDTQRTCYVRIFLGILPTLLECRRALGVILGNGSGGLQKVAGLTVSALLQGVRSFVAGLLGAVRNGPYVAVVSSVFIRTVMKFIMRIAVACSRTLDITSDEDLGAV